MLKKIFISHHFDNDAKELANDVIRLVKSHNIQVETGERLAGQSLDNGVKKIMESCQATIVLLTERPEGLNNNWVKEERAFAAGLKHDTITLLNREINNDGMFSNNEYIELNSERFHQNLLDLSETINIWKSNRGKSIELLIRPEQVSSKISNNIDQFPIKYRIWKNQRGNTNTAPNWTTIIATPSVGGATVFLPNVKEDDLIEFEIFLNGEKWASPAANHNVIVELSKRN